MHKTPGSKSSDNSMLSYNGIGGIFGPGAMLGPEDPREDIPLKAIVKPGEGDTLHWTGNDVLDTERLLKAGTMRSSTPSSCRAVGRSATSIRSKGITVARDTHIPASLSDVNDPAGISYRNRWHASRARYQGVSIYASIRALVSLENVCRSAALVVSTGQIRMRGQSLVS